MLRQILRGHRSACYLRVPSLSLTPIIYHLLVYCFGSFLLQDLFLRVTASKDRAKLEIDPKIKIFKLRQNKTDLKPD